MIYPSKRKKVGIFTETHINVLHGLGLKAERIADIVGVSRATIFRHIRR